MLQLSVEMESVGPMKVSTFAPRTAVPAGSVVMGPVRAGLGRIVRPALTTAGVTWTRTRSGASSAVGLTSGVGTRGALATEPSASSAAPQPRACLTLPELSSWPELCRTSHIIMSFIVSLGIQSVQDVVSLAISLLAIALALDPSSSDSLQEVRTCISS